MGGRCGMFRVGCCKYFLFVAPVYFQFQHSNWRTHLSVSPQILKPNCRSKIQFFVTMRLVLLLAIGGASNAFTTTNQPLSRTPSFLCSSKTSPEEMTKSSVPDFSSSTKPLDEAGIFSSGEAVVNKKWQENLEVLLKPDTSVAERQIVLSDLLNASDQIQESVRTALREGKVIFFLDLFALWK